MNFAMLDTIRYLTSEAWLDLVSNSDEELHVSKAFTVTLDWKSANIIDIVRRPSKLPDKPGIYIIYNGTKAHYVGISERNLHSRFRSRLRVFREFDVNVNSSDFAKLLNNRTVVWATIKNLMGPKKGGVRQSEKDFKGRGRVLTGSSGVLKVLELYLIRKLGTLGRGNIHKENVIFKPGGVINVKRIIGPIHGRIPDKILSVLSSSINTNIRW
jgi:hypothetical protein